MLCLQAQLTIFLNLTLVNNFSVLPECQARPFSSAPEALRMERTSLKVKVAQRVGYNAAPTSLESMYSVNSLLLGTY